MDPLGGFSTRQIRMPLSERLQGATQQDEAVPGDFTEFLMSGVSEVNNSQQTATAQVHELLTGGDVSQVEVMTAVQKADMSFKLLVQIRNKLMAAYEQINSIRI